MVVLHHHRHEMDIFCLNTAFPGYSCKEKFSPACYDRIKYLCPYLGISCALLQQAPKGVSVFYRSLVQLFLAQPVSLYSGTFAPFYQEENLFVSQTAV